MPLAARTLLLFIFLLASSGASGLAWGAEKSILVFGDSLSAAYGIPQERGWVALLAARMRRERPDYSVANASVSGETTAGGASRLRKLLQEKKPAILVLELGANDGLRGLPVAEMKKNLAAMVAEAQRSGVRVLLVGMRLPPNYGPDYTQAFESAFAEVAKRHRAALLPFLLEGVAEDPRLFQADGMHPTAQAQPEIAGRVWSALQPLLRRR